MQPNMMKHQLTRSEMDKILAEAESGVVSTNGSDGYPYGAPVNFIYIEGKLFFHGRMGGEKVDNIRRDPKVCFTVYRESGFEDCGPLACDTTTVYSSVVIRGKAQVIDDAGIKKKVLLAITEKLVPGKGGIDDSIVALTGIYGIDVESMTGKYHRAMSGHQVRG
jgi:uncharacterized protein